MVNKQVGKKGAKATWSNQTHSEASCVYDNGLIKLLHDHFKAAVVQNGDWTQGNRLYILS